MLDFKIDTTKARIAAENAKWPDTLIEVSADKMPPGMPPTMTKAFRSNRFIVLQFAPVEGAVRLSIRKADISDTLIGSSTDGISWDDLQLIKDQCGFEDRDAVEIYPAKQDVVNVANMRHIWIVPNIPFAWRHK